MKSFLIGVAVCWLFCGFMIGSALKIAVPATNYYCGVAYMTLVWPAWIAQPMLHFNMGVPSCAFTFKD